MLDLGCGPGFFEIILSRSGFSVCGVDSSHQMIEQARVNVRQFGDPALVEFLCCDVSELPLDTSCFDVVVSRNVTWLMPDPLKAYSEWHRVLKPGGKMLVFDANWYSYLVDDQINQVRLGDHLRAGEAMRGSRVEAPSHLREETRMGRIRAAIARVR